MTTLPSNKAESAVLGKDGARLPWRSWTCLLLAGVVVFYPVSYSWDFLPDYAFGRWVPLLALFLFSERWSTRPAPGSGDGKPPLGRLMMGWTLLFLGLRLVLETSLGAPSLLWGGALLYVGIVLYWFWVYGGMVWARHFAFPVCFLLLSVPWLDVIQTPLVQGLARLNAWVVAHLLVDLGILAQNTGNVIVLANCTLDVKEACSGIRSLQAALMISFLVGEIYRLAWLKRGGIVLLAVMLAFIGNFLRTMFLALVASAYGVKVMDQWHDTAGTSILIFTSVTTWLIAHFLHLRESRGLPASGKKVLQDLGLPSERPALQLACGVLFGVMAAEVLTQGWFAWKEKQAVRYPTWTAALPTTGKFEELAIPEESQKLLRYDAGREVTWQDERGWTWTAYWFRYHPKPWGEAVFLDHNPDHCLPSVGFLKVGDEVPFVARAHGVQLEVCPKQFSWQGTPVYVFWVVYADRANFPLKKALGEPLGEIGAKIRFYLSGVRQGIRSSTAETESLETIIVGPENYVAARSAYVDELQKIIVPDISVVKDK